MSIRFNDTVKQGHLKCKNKNFGVWKRRWVMLKKCSSRGPLRLEKYEKRPEVGLETPHKVQDLSQVRSVVRLPPDIKRNGLAVIFNDDTAKHYQCDSETDMEDWFCHLHQACFGQLPSQFRPPDIVRSNKEQGMFHVCLVPSPTLEFSGECLMEITDDEIRLFDAMAEENLVISWPLRGLRRYGSDAGMFTIEAGRRCPTGEGVYIFNTKEGESIYQSVDSITKALAHRRTDSISSQSSLSSSSQSSITSLPRPSQDLLLKNRRPPPTPPIAEESQQAIQTPIEGATAPPPLRSPPPRKDSTTEDRRYADAWPPPSASSSALAEGAAVYSEEGVDYEEKYLSPIFREFLSQRKSSFSTQ